MDLKTLRRTHGINSAERLSELSGVSAGMIYKYEQGHVTMGLDNAAKIADALGCTIDEVAGREAPNGAVKLWNLVQDLTPAGKMLLRSLLRTLLNDPDTSYRAQESFSNGSSINLGDKDEE